MYIYIEVNPTSRQQVKSPDMVRRRRVLNGSYIYLHVSMDISISISTTAHLVEVGA